MNTEEITKWKTEWESKGSPRTLVEYVQEQLQRRLNASELQSFIMWALKYS